MGREMWDAWRQSRGHWAVASKRHDWFGAGMAKSKRGVWYATIITVDEGGAWKRLLTGV
jgi:hypothetical protein